MSTNALMSLMASLMHACRCSDEDNVELSDDELIRRFEESVGTPGKGLDQRLQKLEHEGMDLSPTGFSPNPLESLTCLDPMTQDGQNHIWRLQHQKSFNRDSIGTEVPQVCSARVDEACQ